MNNNQPLNLLSIENKSIEECIYNIRGQQVMLDSDVAFFFGVTVSSLNRQMRRNVDRFPSDFCFQLSDKKRMICDAKKAPQIFYLLKEDIIHMHIQKKE